MRYGLARKVSIYDFDGEKGEEFIARPSAWHEASLWIACHKNDHPENVQGTEEVYVWGWFALKQAGKLATYDLGEDLDYKVVDQMMDRFAINLTSVTDGDVAPLVEKRD